MCALLRRREELSEREREQQQRRATNLIWNAAGDYSLMPTSRAYDYDGYADVYMNSIVGAVYKYYDYPTLKRLLDNMENAVQGEVWQDLFWTGLENCAYQRAVAERPAFRLLREGYARMVLAEAEDVNELDLPMADRVKLEHYRRVLGERHKLPPREEKLLAELEFPPELSSEQLVERMKGILKDYFGVTGGMLRRESLAKLPQFMNGIGRRRYGIGARVRSEDPNAKRKKVKVSPLGRISGARTPEQLREYIDDCFGVSMYGQKESAAIEDRLCRGKNDGCMLHFTRGELPERAVRDGEVLLHRKVSRDQAAANRRYFENGIVQHRLAIIRLTEKVRNCILVHLDDSTRKSRAGLLNAPLIWRGVYLNDSRVFLKHERAADNELSVDVLLDGSASQLQRQESVASQAYILAESLTRCGLPVRVYSFCSVDNCTVVRVYRDYDEPERNAAVFDYAAAGFNRDGLALGAAGYLLAKTPYERRLLITLSDCSPNDVKKITTPAGRREDYSGEAGVADSAAEVEKLRRLGVRVMCVFTGEEAELPNARRIYGRELVRIRSISQFADAVGKVIVELIGAM